MYAPWQELEYFFNELANLVIVIQWLLYLLDYNLHESRVRPVCRHISICKTVPSGC